MMEEQLELGCTPGPEYIFCVSAESQARGMGSFIGWLAEIVLGSQEFAPGTTLWDNAIGEASNWLAPAIIVMLMTGMIGIATGALSLKPRRLLVSVAGICAAIPATYIALGVGGALLSISDQLSELALTRISGEEGFENVFRSLAQGGTGSDIGGAALSLAGLSGALPLLLMLIGIMLGLILMSFALAFRNLGLMILIAFSPLAFMAVPMQGGWGIAKKWAMAGIALLLAKPLMFGVLAMLLKTSDGMALFSSQTLTVMMGLFVVAFMPMMAYSFFSFLGSGNENLAGQGMAAQAAQKATAPAQRAAGGVGQQAGSAMFGKLGGVFGGGRGGAASPPTTPNPGGSPTQAPPASPGSNPSVPPTGGSPSPSGPAPGGTPSAPGGTPPTPGGNPGTPGGAPAAPGGGPGSPPAPSVPDPGSTPQVPSSPAAPPPGSPTPPDPGSGPSPGQAPGTGPKW